ncbi:MAG: hypothetical protein FRX49_01503 [Trebouxia sp. A1-2]|nr:MAG: hypothetical protein FRX49_01503 [Trebouxia sp. A1-2]
MKTVTVSPEAIVLDPLKLGLGDRLQLRGGGTAHLLEEGHQVPMPMATEGIPHTLHCQLLQQPPDYLYGTVITMPRQGCNLAMLATAFGELLRCGSSVTLRSEGGVPADRSRLGSLAGRGLGVRAKGPVEPECTDPSGVRATGEQGSMKASSPTGVSPTEPAEASIIQLIPAIAATEQHVPSWGRSMRRTGVRAKGPATEPVTDWGVRELAVMARASKDPEAELDAGPAVRLSLASSPCTWPLHEQAATSWARALHTAWLSFSLAERLTLMPRIMSMTPATCPPQFSVSVDKLDLEDTVHTIATINWAPIQLREVARQTTDLQTGNLSLGSLQALRELLHVFLPGAQLALGIHFSQGNDEDRGVHLHAHSEVKKVLIKGAELVIALFQQGLLAWLAPDHQPRHADHAPPCSQNMYESSREA